MHWMVVGGGGGGGFIKKKKLCFVIKKGKKGEKDKGGCGESV